MRPFALDPALASVRTLAGVGPRIGKLLEGLTGPRIADLFWHLPTSLIDRRYTPKIAQAENGRIATLLVTIEKHIPSPVRSRPYRIKCRDETGIIDLVFFHVKGNYLEQQLPVGEQRLVSGRVEHFQGMAQMAHPDLIAHPSERENVETVEPVYPLTAGITHKTLNKIIRSGLEVLGRVDEWPEWIDPAFSARNKWPSWKAALQAVHHPRDEKDLDPHTPARERLAYDELLANQLAIALVRQNQISQKGRRLPGDDTLINRAIAALPWELTASQKQAVEEIRKDMASEFKMLRLLQGDVGSGKTIVAFFAMLNAVGSGAQAAMMAPTEILARQHAVRLAPLADKLGLKIATLTGRDKGKVRDEILSGIADGSVHIVIGTHALFQKDVTFKDLALVVIDEQHRFGVHQRLELSQKGELADMLVMTATPIPRTLCLTVYGDMEVSRLNEKPSGRKPIDTRLVSLDRIDEVVEGLKRKIAGGSRAYWVCPLVEESEKIDLAAAEERFLKLQETFGSRVGLIHGRLKPADKDRIMEDFAEGRLDILVATTVIEVGIDVKEASVMVIEHAERFGLAQLHQLRGRIGRGEESSTCILLFFPHIGEIARQRLQTIRNTEDGFVIAEEDLKLRGAGELLGTKQSGLPHFRLSDLNIHASLLQAARDDAKLIIHRDPTLTGGRGQALRHLLYLFERDAAVKYLRSG